MSHSGDIIYVGDKKVFLVKGIFDYFDKNNFNRLLAEHEQAKKAGAEFFVALYSDEILERVGHTRKLKGLVNDEDRIAMLEAIDFVDGAFIVNSNKRQSVEESLKARMFEKMVESKEAKPDVEKKYKIGYASGAFSNLHKGHIEHLKEMSEQCQTVIVAANSDNLIKNYKHKEVTVDENTRRLILSHIKYVDMAIITDEYDKLKAVSKVRDLCGKEFDAIFVGSDWKGDPKWDNFEKKLKTMGIDVVFTDRPENGISTTKIDGTKGIKNEKKSEMEINE